MENRGDSEQRSLLNELMQGRELAKQLQSHLNSPSSASHEARELLLQKILISYEKALSILKGGGASSSATAADPPHLAINVGGVSVTESPRSRSESPRSEDSDRDFREQDASRKRKALPRWTQQVQVSPGSGLDAPLDDGFCWRKYGQKDILGAKYPRGYYRCTHRNVQGCLATKLVQRSDDDPTILEVTYRGHHTCSQAAAAASSSGAAATGASLPLLSTAAPPPETLDKPGPRCDDISHPGPPPQNPRAPQEILLNFQSGLRVVTEDLEPGRRRQPPPDPPFSFPPRSVTAAFPSPAPPPIDGGFSAAFSSTFMPPPSGSGFFSMPQTRVGDFGRSDPNQSQGPGSGSDLADIIAAATTSAAVNNPTVELDNPFAQLEFDPNFSFGNPGFFP